MEEHDGDHISHTDIASCLLSIGFTDHQCKELLELCAYTSQAKVAAVNDVDTLRSVRSL